VEVDSSGEQVGLTPAELPGAGSGEKEAELPLPLLSIEEHLDDRHVRFEGLKESRLPDLSRSEQQEAAPGRADALVLPPIHNAM
jgi:hypothetical protein